MNRDDTQRYYAWLFWRDQCKRLMAICLVLAAVWALFPLGVPVLANTAALDTVCQSTTGCTTARLCAGWHDKKEMDQTADEASSDWRPEVDVCMKGRFAQGAEVLSPGTVKGWLPFWVRPLLSNHNRVWWRRAA